MEDGAITSAAVTQRPGSSAHGGRPARSQEEARQWLSVNRQLREILPESSEVTGFQSHIFEGFSPLFPEDVETISRALRARDQGPRCLPRLCFQKNCVWSWPHLLAPVECWQHARDAKRTLLSGLKSRAETCPWSLPSLPRPRLAGGRASCSRYRRRGYICAVRRVVGPGGGWRPSTCVCVPQERSQPVRSPPCVTGPE